MRDVKKILEMRSQNFSQRKIAEALKVSRDIVRKVGVLKKLVGIRYLTNVPAKADC